MSSNIIDRRKNTKGKSINNRQKFLKRVEDQIKKAIPDVINQESITDSGGEGKVKIPIKGIKEPSFRNKPGTGQQHIVRPGNDKFNEGDQIPKPPGGGGGQGAGQGKGSNSPEITEDDFIITLSREEFLKYFFDDLELPNLVKKQMASTVDFKNQRAGYTMDGVPSRLNLGQSYQQALGRRIAMKGAYDAKIRKLQQELENTDDPEEYDRIVAEIKRVERLKGIVPFFNDVDLRYNNFEQIPQPVTSAVMFCIMDVSASMGFHEKDIAKRFFTLLYLFLTKQYQNVELVFIRHHTEAKEVSEEEFFNSRESGGTVVAPSLRLMKKIMKERYDASQWNIYCCQASDGDVWSAGDALDCEGILKKDVLPFVQYMAYIEIKQNKNPGYLWRAYQRLQGIGNIQVRNIYHVTEIWPIFKDLFHKKAQT